VDTLSAIRGPHTIRTGLDYQRLTPARESPSESVTGWWPTLADVLANSLPVVATTSADQASALVETLSFFVQDTWSVSPRLTFTYGLRWEITPPPAIREPAVAASGSAPAAPIAPILPVAPITQAQWKTNYGQVAPRFGVAYRLDSRSVLRARWGMFYDTGFSTALDPINGFPFNRWQFGLGGAASSNSPGYGLRIAPSLKLPYVAEWNISWERMFGLRNVASAAYVGSTGRAELVGRGQDWEPRRYAQLMQPGSKFSRTHTLQGATNVARRSSMEKRVMWTLVLAAPPVMAHAGPYRNLAGDARRPQGGVSHRH